MKISAIDHIHVYVDDITQAERWYHSILTFSRDESRLFWFEQGGPLVITNHGASLALFRSSDHSPGHTVAFAVEAAMLLQLIPTLKRHHIPFTVGDHQVSMSVYFSDPSRNKIEVTSYQYLQAKQHLQRLAQGCTPRG